MCSISGTVVFSPSGAGRVMGRILSLVALLMAGWLFAAPLSADEYRLGVGDVVQVQVYEQPDLTTTAPIGQAGTIRFWLLGEVEIDGLTAAEAEKRLEQRLENEGFIKNPQVIVSITQFRSQQVSVLGWVNKAGKYPISEEGSTVIDMLAQAGGLKDDAGDVVTVIATRGGTRTRKQVDLGLIYKGMLEENIALRDTDVVIVPRMNVFYMYGEISRPNQYRLERNMTVMQALSMGGGLTAKGTDNGIKVTRTNDKGEITETTVDLNSFIQPNDVLYIKESLF
jgi:polysaccharide export outer membrane protein